MKKPRWNWADASPKEYWIRFCLCSMLFLFLVSIPVLARAVWFDEWRSIGIFVGGSLVHGAFAFIGLAFLRPRSLAGFCVGAAVLTMVSRTLVLLPSLHEGTAGAMAGFLLGQAIVVALAASASFLFVGSVMAKRASSA